MTEWLKQLAEEYGRELTVMDGYDDCIVGIVEQCTKPPLVCYAREKVIAALMRDGATWEQAEEYFTFNQLGAWVGETTPCFLTK